MNTHSIQKTTLKYWCALFLLFFHFISLYTTDDGVSYELVCILNGGKCEPFFIIIFLCFHLTYLNDSRANITPITLYVSVCVLLLCTRCLRASFRSWIYWTNTHIIFIPRAVFSTLITTILNRIWYENSISIFNAKVIQ